MRTLALSVALFSLYKFLMWAFSGMANGFVPAAFLTAVLGTGLFVYFERLEARRAENSATY